MKKIIAGLAVFALLVLPAIGQEKEEDRVEKAGTVMKEIMDIPDDIPQDVIDKADCVVVLPSVLKFAFGIGGSYGRGVMTCRSGKNFHGPWSAPTMMALEGASFGLQLGGQATDFVLLLMSPKSASSILGSKVKLGVMFRRLLDPWAGMPRPRPMSVFERKSSRTLAPEDCSLEYRWPDQPFVLTMTLTRSFMAKRLARRTSCLTGPSTLPSPRASCLPL